ncbi:MAG TPA: tetratricopeptide repeat protein [Beijerinckiaceae bacterium]|nr:tetratricopeptide repeat protein [Beijerinckiaceae bacterium]
MGDFIREVDEEYRRDRIMAIWKRYSGVIVGVIVLVVAGVGGWRYWQHMERQRAEAAAVRYEEAVRLAREGKSDEAEQRLAALAKEAPPGYQTLSRFRLAAEQGRQNPDAGAKAYDALAADGGVEPVMQDLARLRAAMLRIDTADSAAVQPSLERLATPTNVWRHTARELLGLSALKRGDYDAAGRWFDQIAADRDTPQGLRGRLELYTSLVAGGPVQTTTQ